MNQPEDQRQNTRASPGESSALLDADFIDEVRELENQNQHTLKQWRIAKQAGLDDIRREFADIEAEHFLSQTGITQELRNRINNARAKMWLGIESKFGPDITAQLRASI